MASKLSPREKTLVIIFSVLLIGVLYYLLFYSPMQSKMELVTTEQADIQTSIDNATIKLEHKKVMQKELDEIFSAAGGNPTPISDYDNLNAVIVELNNKLSGTSDYQLSFDEVNTDVEDGIIRRTVHMTFACADYASAESVLAGLAKSDYRTLFTELSINCPRKVYADSLLANGTTDNKVDVSATLVYYEYMGGGAAE